MRNDGSVTTKRQLVKALNNSMALPKIWKEATFDAVGADPVLITPKPTITELQRVVVADPVQDVLGNWVEAWSIVDKFSDYTDENDVLVTKAEQETAFLDNKYSTKRQQLNDSLLRICDEKLKSLQAGYPEREVLTWDAQSKEAEAYLKDNTTPTPFISAALNADETVEQYATLISTNNAAWSTYAGSIVQLRRKYEAKIVSATNGELDSLNTEISEL